MKWRYNSSTQLNWNQVINEFSIELAKDEKLNSNNPKSIGLGQDLNITWTNNPIWYLIIEITLIRYWMIGGAFDEGNNNNFER